MKDYQAMPIELKMVKIKTFLFVFIITHSVVWVVFGPTD